MKNVKKVLILALILSALMCVSAFAAEEPTISQIDMAKGVDNVTFMINEGAVNFNMTYTGAQDGMFLVLVLGKDTAYDEETGVFAPKAEDILYVNQTTSDDGDVSFTAEGDNVIYPSGIEDQSMVCLAGAGLDKITLLGVITANQVEPDYLRGDVNMDKKVDIGDHQCLFEHLQGITIITNDAQLIIADTNQDGKVDIGDHQCLFEHLQGINPFTVE